MDREPAAVDELELDDRLLDPLLAREALDATVEPLDELLERPARETG